ncbi:MAG: hypothetical protein AB8H03_04455 [Saprospiraceae bacterium]
MNKEIISLIQKNKTKEAIKLLKGKSLPIESKKILSLIESEFNLLNQEILKETISFEEKLIRRNRINDRLLSIVQKEPNSKIVTNKKSKRLFLYLLPLILIGFSFVAYNYINNDRHLCPIFPESSLNKILLIPFENVGNQKANPEIIIRDKISKLTLENNLSTSIKLGERAASLTIEDALDLAKYCKANVIIWGKYSNTTDSINLILQYHFLDQPDWSNMGELIVLKDITFIQNGEMLKNIEDAILLLCSVIATRQGNKPLAKKWLDEVIEQDSIDHQLRKVLGLESTDQ